MALHISEKWKRSYERYYDGAQEAWRRLSALDKGNNIVRLCADIPHDAVLEVGAGDGAVTARLAELGFARRFAAAEIAASAKAAIDARDIPGFDECRLFDGHALPWPDDAFDLVVLSHVVEHLEYPRALLHEAARVGRHVFVEVPLEHTLRMGPDYVFNEMGHINFYSPRTIRRLLQTCDLEIIEQIITHSNRDVYSYQTGRRGLLKHRVKDTLLRLSPRLATLVLTYHTALLCRRAEAPPGAD